MDKLKPNKEIVIRENGTKRVVTVPIGESRTQQQFKDQCNVNKIIAKFKATGSGRLCRSRRSSFPYGS